MSKIIDKEGTRRITTVYQPHEETLYVNHDSREFEAELYAQNQMLRNMEQSGKGSVRLHLQMSEQDYEQLLLKYPLLQHGTTSQRRKLWMKIAKKHPELVAMPFKPRVFQPGDKHAR